jgi:hypothetical protein
MPLGRNCNPSPDSKLISSPPTKDPTSPATKATDQLRTGADQHAEQDESEDKHDRSIDE